MARKHRPAKSPQKTDPPVSQPTSSAPSAAAPPSTRESPQIASRRVGPALLAWVGVATACAIAATALAADWWTCLPDDAPLEYVGRQACITCHQQEAQRWTGSHHDLAMDLATPDTVLGDFQDATLTHHGVTSRMFRRGDKFFVNTEGPDGRMSDFQVKYVLGVTPLQQYMVEFDRKPDQPAHEIARLQVLRISWDTMTQRWFHLDPPDVADKLSPDDALHWTGVLQRWNNMCADCHSTNLLRQYDAQRGEYHTTFSEIDVSCEACHGPGNLHVELAQAKSFFWDRKRGYALAKLKGPSNQGEIEACAPCHSRRSIVSSNHRPGDPYYDGYHNELLGELTYHADGQILDEVYEYGSFLQSKMYHKGIRCSDCHDPHSLQVRFPDNRLCTSCHAHPAGKYDGPAHHHHSPSGSGSKCVNCHMPVTKYMAVDPRRDHSLRIPRPALSVELGTPNACTGCHLEVDGSRQRLPEAKRAQLGQYADWLRAKGDDEEIRSELERMDRWSLTAARKWWGDKGEDAKHYAHALHAAQTRQPDAERRLTSLAENRQAPAIVRATALERLARIPTPDSLRVAEKLLESPDSQIQLAALGRLETELDAIESQLDPSAGIAAAANAYRNVVRQLNKQIAAPRRAVRVAAARMLVRVPEPVRQELLDGVDRDRLEQAVDEFLAGLQVNSDRAGSHLGAAMVHEARGDYAAAVESYETAIRVEPRATGPRGNLAALYDRLAEAARRRIETVELRGDRAMAEQVRKELVRCEAEAKRLRAEELVWLERDAKLGPRIATAQYRYAMSLYIHGRESEAEEVLRKTTELDPSWEQAWLALGLLYEKQQKFADALRCIERLRQLNAQDPTYAELERRLRTHQ